MDFAIGPEKVEGVKEFRKARIADDKWVDSLIKNADPSSPRSSTSWPSSRPSCLCPCRHESTLAMPIGLEATFRHKRRPGPSRRPSQWII